MTEHMVEDFFKSELYAGTVVSAEPLQDARIPAWVLSIDFGLHGIKKASARITRLYRSDELIGRQVIALLNVPPRQIGNVISECLVLGLPLGHSDDAKVILLQPEQSVPNGTRVS